VRALFGVAVCLLCVVAIGCESSPELPTDVGDEPAFTRITFDMRSLQPELGATFVAGDAFDYFVAASWEFTDEDWADFESHLGLDFEGYVQITILYWENDSFFGERWIPLNVDTLMGGADVTRTGTLEFAGTMTVPLSSSDCGRYDELSIEAVLVWADHFGSDAGSEKSGGTRLGTRYPVADTRAPLGACIVGSYRDKPYAWGDDLGLVLLNVDNTGKVEMFIDGRPMSVEERYFRIYPGPDQTEFHVSELTLAIPPGSLGGIVTARVDGQPAAQGGTPIQIEVTSQAADAHDPANDDWQAAVEAFADPPYLLRSNELVLTASDRVPDAGRNPFGTSDHGVGDWWRVQVPDSATVCVKAFRDSADEIDLFLTDEAGAATDVQNFSRPGWEALKGPSVGPGETFLLWVAPKSISTSLGAYALTVADCAYFTPRLGFPPELQGAMTPATGNHE